MTRELLAWPHVHDWVLRVSVADIAADGPFSAFAGVDRWFAVLAGAGVRLAGRPHVRADGLLAFAGESAPQCELLDGPTQDFNLMHRRGHGHVLIQHADQPLLPQARWVGLFTAEGGLLTHGSRAMPLAPMSLAWCESPALQSCLFEGVGAAWWMCWHD